MAAHRNEEKMLIPSMLAVHTKLYFDCAPSICHLHCRPWRGMLVAGRRSSPRRAAPAT